MKELFVIVLIGCLLKMAINKPQPMIVYIDDLSYKKDILPIIERRCAGCHNYSTPDRNWLRYEIVYQKRTSIKMRLQNKTMPPGNLPLLDSERNSIIQWVDQGAKK